MSRKLNASDSAIKLAFERRLELYINTRTPKRQKPLVLRNIEKFKSILTRNCKDAINR